MPGRSRSRNPRPKKLSVIELFGVLLWFSQAVSPLVALKYSKTMAEYLSYPPAALALIVLAFRIHDKDQQISARMANQTRFTIILEMAQLYTAAALLTALGLIGGEVMKGLAHYLTHIGMALVWLVLGIVAYFVLQQGSFKDTIIFLVWFAFAQVTVTLGPTLGWTWFLYIYVLVMCTINYLLKFYM